MDNFLLQRSSTKSPLIDEFIDLLHIFYGSVLCRDENFFALTTFSSQHSCASHLPHTTHIQHYIHRDTYMLQPNVPSRRIVMETVTMTGSRKTARTLLWPEKIMHTRRAHINTNTGWICAQNVNVGTGAELFKYICVTLWVSFLLGWLAGKRLRSNLRWTQQEIDSTKLWSLIT